MRIARFITALGTPLQDDDRLHVAGLADHLDDQAAAGIDALLVAGTMGMMPLLTEATWRELVTQSVTLARGRFELLIGATDLSTARALERVAFLNTIEGIDGVVVMAPGLIKFAEAEYLAYFGALADASRRPLYLYDLEPLTGAHLSVATIGRLADHPNIAGIKLSSNVAKAAQLHLHLAGKPFRLILSEPVLSDMLFRHGYDEHLDGIYCVCPHWAAALAHAARQGDWDEAARWQARLSAIKELFQRNPFGPTFTGLMNLRGLEGRYAPRPLSVPDEAYLTRLRQYPIVCELLAPTPVEPR